MRREERPNDEAAAKEGWVTRKEGPGGKVIILLVALVLLGLFVLQNTEEIRIDFLFWHGRWPAWIVILLVALLGLIVGWIIASARGRRRRLREAG